MINIRNCADGKVTEPGLYRMTAEQYHADPCPEPSLRRRPSGRCWSARHDMRFTITCDSAACA